MRVIFEMRIDIMSWMMGEFPLRRAESFVRFHWSGFAVVADPIGCDSKTRGSGWLPFFLAADPISFACQANGSSFIRCFKYIIL